MIPGYNLQHNLKTPLIILLWLVMGWQSLAIATVDIIPVDEPALCHIEDKKIIKIAEVFDLQENDEDDYGHTIKRHVAKDIEYLQKRLHDTPSLKVVSSYNNISIASTVIQDALKLDADRIARWINTPDTQNSLFLAYKTESVLGYSISRDNMKDTVPISNFVIILRKHSNDCGFNVVTSYPTNQLERMKYVNKTQ